MSPLKPFLSGAFHPVRSGLLKSTSMEVRDLIFLSTNIAVINLSSAELLFKQLTKVLAHLTLNVEWA